MKIEKLVPDTSVIIEGIVSKEIESGQLQPSIVMIHNAALSELEHQANQNKSQGYMGLDEIKKLTSIKKKYDFSIQFIGKRPSSGEIKYASLGEIDSIIRESAYEEDGTLFTADKVQAKVADAKEMKLIIAEVEVKSRKLKLDGYFDEQTMSVHLRENVVPTAKKGFPGKWDFVKLSEKLLTRESIQDVSREIIEEANIRRDGFIEIERSGSTIVQLGKYRIVITRPPFSDGWEITAVRPVKRLDIDDYHLSEKLQKRIGEQAEGILIAGSPGMGKSTFAQALAEFYASKGKIVKTIEAPRDLILSENITQYAISHGSPQEIHDILLLSRPDYTLFDEMRNTEDFKLFADMRLAGIGLAGVIHATKPVDAIQRFVGRIELGVIPHVVDTVIFIKNGQVAKILSLQMVVKVPAGMTEADLARPIVTIDDFESGKAEYELYSYGEETVVVPVTEEIAKEGGARKLAAKEIEREMEKHADMVKVKVIDDNNCIVQVPKHDIAGIIGKQGSNIEKIQKKIGMHINVEELNEVDVAVRKASGTKIPFEIATKGKVVYLLFDEGFIGKNVDIYVEGEILLNANVGKRSDIRLKRDQKIGRTLINAAKYKELIEVILVE